jgi:hypothetical protein
MLTASGRERLPRLVDRAPREKLLVESIAFASERRL